MINCLLTFDIEEWFQVENLRSVFPPEKWGGIESRVGDSTRLVLKVLAEHGLKATFFVLGWVAERDPRLIEEIVEGGHEVASHGYGHIRPLQLEMNEFREDILRAREVLESTAGREVVGYRAPSFSIDQERLCALAECGFQYDSSHHPFRLHARYGRLTEPGRSILPGVYRVEGRLLEVGLPVERWGPLALPASGGAYFRLYPGALFRGLVRRVMSRIGYYIMYLHSWEFDPHQPRVRDCGFVAGKRHYTNLHKTLIRFHRLVRMLKGMGVKFITVREFADTVTESQEWRWSGREEQHNGARDPIGGTDGLAGG